MTTTLTPPVADLNRATIKSLWGRRGKLVMSLAAIVLAVGFVAGSMIFTGHLQTQYTNLALGRLPDLVVAAEGALDPERRDAAQLSYSDAQIAAVRAVPGVANVEARNSGVGIGFDNRDQTPANQGLVQIEAMGWTQFPMTTGAPALEIVQGREPERGEIVLDQTTFNRADYRLGEKIEMVIWANDQTTTLPLTLVGVGGWTAGADASQWVFFNHSQLDELAGVSGRLQLWVELTADADAAAVASAINAKLPGSKALVAANVAELQGGSQADAMGFLQPLLLVFAAISVVVACFMIVNTFSILVLQRTRELALWRALGASGGQVRRSVLIEALVTGIVGSVLGVLAGWGLAAGLLRVMGGDAAGLRPSLQIVLLAIVLGVVVTLASSLLPARRAAKVAPVIAMQGAAAAGRQARPKAARPCQVASFSRPLTRLAGLNASRRPGRTVATAATLAIGLGLVGLLGVLGASMKASIAEMVPDALGSDFLVMSSTPITVGQIEAFEAQPQVEAVHRYEAAGASIGDEQTVVTGLAPADYGTAIQQTMDAGRPAERAGELAVSKTKADQQRWSVGQRIDGVINGQAISWQIVGIFSYPDNIAMSDYMTSPDTLRQAGLPEQAIMLAIQVRADADLAVAKTALAKQVADTPGATLLDAEEYNKLAGGQVDMMLNMVYALIAMSVIIAALGIINTLSLSVVERTRELGLLRAIGMTRGQLRGLVVRESVLISVLGGGTGLLAGVGAGVLLQTTMRDQLVALAIPWTTIGVVGVLIVLIGVIAALAPAIRASRTPVLVAIAA